MKRLFVYALGIVLAVTVPKIEVASLAEVLSVQREEQQVSDVAEAGIKVLALVNETREANGVSPLEWDSDLYEAAQVRAREASECWSHTRPNGSEWYTVDASKVYGENLSRGFTTPEGMVNAWMTSPAHKDNVLFPDFKTMAVAEYISSSGTVFAAQLFGY